MTDEERKSILDEIKPFLAEALVRAESNWRLQNLMEHEQAGRCWLFHNWNRWKTQEGEHYHDGHGPVPATYQMRACLRCGKTQIERFTG